ncbi:MAG: hypothetical protein NW207_01800 [Cytophagales bacterium]|nr:hypothetical protein [Cytophagales bacterium]
MRKYLTLIVIFLSVLYTCGQDDEYTAEKYRGSAPDRLYIGIRGNILLPVVTFADLYRSGVGAGVQAKYVIEDKIALGAFADYQILGPRGGAVVGVTHTLAVYGGSLEYIFPDRGKNFRPYIGVDAAYYNHAISQNINTMGGTFSSGTSGGSFGIAPNIGVNYKVNRFVIAYTNFKYHHILALPIIFDATAQCIGLSGGFLFMLGR